MITDLVLGVLVLAVLAAAAVLVGLRRDVNTCRDEVDDVHRRLDAAMGTPTARRHRPRTEPS